MSKKSRNEVAQTDEAGARSHEESALVAAPREMAPGWAPTEIAEVEANLGGFRFRARAQMSPAGLLAIGGLVGAILLSTAVVVHAARR